LTSASWFAGLAGPDPAYDWFPAPLPEADEVRIDATLAACVAAHLGGSSEAESVRISAALRKNWETCEHSALWLQMAFVLRAQPQGGDPTFNALLATAVLANFSLLVEALTRARKMLGDFDSLRFPLADAGDKPFAGELSLLDYVFDAPVAAPVVEAMAVASLIENGVSAAACVGDQLQEARLQVLGTAGGEPFFLTTVTSALCNGRPRVALEFLRLGAPAGFASFVSDCDVLRRDNLLNVIAKYVAADEPMAMDLARANIDALVQSDELRQASYFTPSVSPLGGASLYPLANAIHAGLFSVAHFCARAGVTDGNSEESVLRVLRREAPAVPHRGSLDGLTLQAPRALARSGWVDFRPLAVGAGGKLAGPTLSAEDNEMVAALMASPRALQPPGRLAVPRRRWERRLARLARLLAGRFALGRLRRKRPAVALSETIVEPAGVPVSNDDGVIRPTSALEHAIVEGNIRLVQLYLAHGASAPRPRTLGIAFRTLQGPMVAALFAHGVPEEPEQRDAVINCPLREGSIYSVFVLSPWFRPALARMLIAAGGRVASVHDLIIRIVLLRRHQFWLPNAIRFALETAREQLA